MRIINFLKKNQLHLIALTFTVIICGVIGFFFDYYFALNDDVLIKNIYSGAYTGSSEALAVYIRAPLGWLLCLLYTLIPVIPWFDLLVLLCQMGSIYIICDTTLTILQGKIARIIAMFVIGAIIVFLSFQELIFIQYTVTAAFLVGAAAFRFYLTNFDKEESTIHFIKTNLLSIVCLLIAFCLRFEITLLLLPIVAVTGFIQLTYEKSFFSKKAFLRYAILFGTIIASMGVIQIVDNLAYSSNEWREYRAFNEERTRLYDYLEVPPYVYNAEFYESVGITETDYQLYSSYNISLDENLTTEKLTTLADYDKQVRDSMMTTREKLRDTYIKYRYRTLRTNDSMWNVTVIALYIIAMIIGLANRKWGYFWRLPLLLVVRSGLWMYVMFRQRYPDRITHSLYLVEVLVLAAFILLECSKEKVKKHWWGGFVVVVGVVLITISAKQNIAKCNEVYQRNELIHEEYEEIVNYTAQEPKSFFFLDVYSVAAFKEKLFENSNRKILNFDMLGGWISKSPLMREKYQQFQITEVDESLCLNENVYFIVKDGEEQYLERTESWMKEYYKEQGHIIVMQPVTTIECSDGERYVVYQVEE